MKIVSFALMLLSFQVFADSWNAAEVRASVSPDGRYLVKTKPSTSLPKIGASAIAYTFIWDGKSYKKTGSFKLLNDIAPSYILVTNGSTLFTFDDHGQLGSDNALNIYSMKGTVIRSYTLDDLFSSEQIEKFKVTVSSVWWRDTKTPPWTFDEIVCINDSIGGSFVVAAITGDIKYSVNAEAGCKLAL